jgi:hypothetical protein
LPNCVRIRGRRLRVNRKRGRCDPDIDANTYKDGRIGSLRKASEQQRYGDECEGESLKSFHHDLSFPTRNAEHHGNVVGFIEF